MADRPGRGVHHPGRAGRDPRSFRGHEPRRPPRVPVDLHHASSHRLFRGRHRPREVSPHPAVPLGLSARAGPGSQGSVIRAALCALAIGAVRTVAAQGSPDVTAHAESLRAAGRPWHAAEALLTAAARDDRAASLLIGQPWLATYGDGEPLALLAQAEAHLGRFADAARDFGAARARASGARAAMLAVRQALAFEGAGAPDSAAPLYAAARRDLPAIGPWLALREAAVTRDTVQAFRLLDGAPPGAGRAVLVARARALLASGDSADAFDAFRAAGRTLDAARLALARGDTARGRAALYDLMARAPESDPAAAAVPLVW